MTTSWWKRRTPICRRACASSTASIRSSSTVKATHRLLSQFGADRPTAQAHEAAFAAAGMGRPSVWQALRHQAFLGSEAMARAFRTGVYSRQELPITSVCTTPRLAERCVGSKRSNATMHDFKTCPHALSQPASAQKQ